MKISTVEIELKKILHVKVVEFTGIQVPICVAWRRMLPLRVTKLSLANQTKYLRGWIMYYNPTNTLHDSNNCICILPVEHELSDTDRQT